MVDRNTVTEEIKKKIRKKRQRMREIEGEEGNKGRGEKEGLGRRREERRI